MRFFNRRFSKLPFPASFSSSLVSAIVLAAVIPALSVSLPMIYRLFEVTKGQVERELDYSSERVAAAFENEIVLISSRASALSVQSDILHYLEGKESARSLRYLMDDFTRQNTAVAALYMLDPAGRFLGGSPQAMDQAPIPDIWKQWLARADLSGGQLNHTSYQILEYNDASYVARLAELRWGTKAEAYRGKWRSDVLLTMFLPVTDRARKVRAMLAVVLPMENLHQCHLWRIRPPGTLKILQDGHSLLVPAPGEHNLQANTFVSARTPLHMTHGADGRNLNFELEVTKPKSQEFAFIWEVIWRQLFGLAIGVLLLAGFALLFSKVLRQPIRELTRQVEAYTAGNYAFPAPVLKFKELDAFSRLLTEMGKTIAAQIEQTALWERYQGEIERSKMQTALDNLREQMRPHFLFNTLNNIAVMVTESPEKSVTMLMKLAELYRLILESSKFSTTPLDQEMRIVENYLEIQKMRFEERLTYEIFLADAAKQIQAPSLVLQTLVENAIKHGIQRSRAGGHISVKIEPDQNLFRVEIRNTGAPLGPGEGTGTGLQNTKKRLDLLYGDSHHFSIAMTDLGETLVSFFISGEHA